MRQSLSEYCIAHQLTLSDEWVSEMNGSLTPQDITRGSSKKVWWRCDKGHIWQASVYTRTEGSGCPYCAGKRVQSGSNDLVTLFPNVARDWNPEKNRTLRAPAEYAPGSHQKVWWICKNGHEWQATIHSRTSGCGCPVCANRIPLVGFNDLATTHPDLAAEWDIEKNGLLLPADVVAGNDRRVYWNCEKGHTWRARISSRARDGSGCPYCSGKQTVPGENDLASAFPQIAAEWDSQKNNGMTPKSVTPQSNKKVWWRCAFGHSYAAAVAARTAKSSGCPYCAGVKVLTGFNDLATKDPQVAKEWHPTLNGALTPEAVTAGSAKRVWWRCAEGHVWRAVIYSRAASQHCGCPVCAGKTKSAARYQDIMMQSGRMPHSFDAQETAVTVAK